MGGKLEEDSGSNVHSEQKDGAVGVQVVDSGGKERVKGSSGRGQICEHKVIEQSMSREWSSTGRQTDSGCGQ